MVSAVASALWQCVKPCPISVARDAYRLSHHTRGRRSQTYDAAGYRHGSVSRTLVPPRSRDVTSTSANPRMRLNPMPRTLEHASAPKPTPLSTTSIVRRPSVTRASTSIQPCESPGYACITAFEHASVKTRARSSANCCEQHPRHSLRTNSSTFFRSLPTSAGIARNRSCSVGAIAGRVPLLVTAETSARTTLARCIDRVALPARRRETDRWAHRP